MKQFWIWPIALYLFLGGLGGGMMATAAVVGLIIAPSALTSGALVWGVFIAFLILGIGTGLLVFELGQPWIFYRAFVTRTSVIKWGAVFLSISMIAGVLFIFWELSWLTGLPFIPYEGFAQVLLGIAGIFGLCVTIYTGVLLSSMKSRPFWNTPVLPVLFMVSGCSTGAALLSMCIGVWPFPAEWLQVNLSTPLAALLGKMRLGVNSYHHQAVKTLAPVLRPMALAAAACGTDGLIIEVHNDPMHALCDGAQSIKPEEYDALCRDVRTIREVAMR